VAAVRRADVFLARLDPTLGGEIKKTRPVVIVSNDALNRFSRLAVVVPLTKNITEVSPSHTVVPAGVGGLSVPSKVVTEQIKAIDQRRLVRRLGTLPPEQMVEVEGAIKNTLALR
jgi:mRNA interferase MazF